jgi:hypothetical protein
MITDFSFKSYVPTRDSYSNSITGFRASVADLSTNVEIKNLGYGFSLARVDCVNGCTLKLLVNDWRAASDRVFRFVEFADDTDLIKISATKYEDAVSMRDVAREASQYMLKQAGIGVLNLRDAFSDFH